MSAPILHGHATRRGKSPEYQTWTRARNRCLNANDPKWKRYGGRGIEMRYRSFEEFLSDVGPKPSNDYSLDRINNEGHYEPGNCRWATRAQQNANRRIHLIAAAKRLWWANRKGLQA